MGKYGYLHSKGRSDFIEIKSYSVLWGFFWYQGTKLTFLARSHLAPKFSKVVAKAKMLGAIKKKR